MAVFSVRRRRFAPAGVALEASHEAAGAGLVAGFMFGPGSTSYIDLCGNVWTENFRHSIVVNPATGKPAALCTDAGNRLTLANGMRLLSPVAGSVAISSRITSYIGNYPRRLQTPSRSFELARNASNTSALTRLFSATEVAISTSAAFFTTATSVMGMSWDASNTTAKRQLYSNGVLVGSSNTAPGTTPRTDNLILSGGAGEIDWLFLFDRSVDQQALFDAPEAMVRQRVRRVYFDVPGGGGGLNLAIAPASHAHASGVPDLTSDSALAMAGDTHTHTTGSLTLEAASADNLAIDGDAHAHAADSPALSTQLALSIASAAHAHMADGINLTAEHVLTVADALHAHAADALALSVDMVLDMAGDAHAHASDTPTLVASGADDLVVAGDSHAHASDAVALTTASVLAVADALHGHASDTPALSTELLLAIAHSLHAHSADAPALSDVPSLAVAHALHAHVAAAADLSTAVLLVIAGDVHAHLSTDAELGFAATLAILEAMHAHAADSLVLTEGGWVGLPDEIRAVIRERFIAAVARERRILRS